MAHNPQSPIGVYDSGVGGLTVLKQLRECLPGEDIIYFGDSINCPFGNRSEQELAAITQRIFAFFRERGVKLTVSACNTTSALFQLKIELKNEEFPILGIIEPIARKIAQMGLDEIGVIATEFTISSGIYEKLVRAASPGIKVWGQGSRNLASLVDACRFDTGEIADEVQSCIDALTQHRPLENILLACTHYPIVREEFCRAAPGVVFLDPAAEQAKAARVLLEEKNLQNTQASGKLKIYTSGEPALFEKVADKIGLVRPYTIEKVVL